MASIIEIGDTIYTLLHYKVTDIIDHLLYFTCIESKHSASWPLKIVEEFIEENQWQLIKGHRSKLNKEIKAWLQK